MNCMRLAQGWALFVVAIGPVVAFECYQHTDNRHVSNITTTCQTGIGTCFRARSNGGNLLAASCGNCDIFNAEAKQAKLSATCKVCNTDKCNSDQLFAGVALAPAGFECHINIGSFSNVIAVCETGVTSCSGALSSDRQIFLATCGTCDEIDDQINRGKLPVECFSCDKAKCNSDQPTSMIATKSIPSSQAGTLECYVNYDEFSHFSAKCEFAVDSCFRAESSDGKLLVENCGNCDIFNAQAKQAKMDVRCKSCTTDKCNSKQLFAGIAPVSGFKCHIDFGSISNVIGICEKGINTCSRSQSRKGKKSVATCGNCNEINLQAKDTEKFMTCSSCSSELCNSIDNTQSITASDIQSTSGAVGHEVAMQYATISASWLTMALLNLKLLF